LSYRVLRGQFCSGVVVCLFFVVLAAPALGDVVSYSTQGVYFEVDYDPALFGIPDTTPGAVLFPATDLEALSPAGESKIDVVYGNLIVTVTGLAGATIDSIEFLEGGTYTLAGPAGDFEDTPEQASYAQVKATLNVNCLFLEVDGQDVTLPGLNQTAIFQDGDAFNPGDSPVGGPWTLEHTVDIAGALASAQIPGGATRAIFLITNALLAQSEQDSSAQISKTWFNIVPEPSSLVLLMLGCCAWLASRSCRRTY